MTNDRQTADVELTRKDGLSVVAFPRLRMRTGTCSLLRFVLAGTAILALVWMVHAGWVAFRDPAPHGGAGTRNLRSGARLQIHGVSYSAIVNEHTLMTLKAERLVVRKKKIGVWRVGWGQEAVVDNATLTVSRPAAGHRQESASGVAVSPLGGLQELAHCATVRLAPVVLTVYGEGGASVKLAAGWGEVANRWKEMALGGRVTVTCGDQCVETDRLAINFADGSLAWGAVHRPEGADRGWGAVASELAALLH